MPNFVRVPDRISAGDFTDVLPPTSGDNAKALVWSHVNQRFEYASFDAAGTAAAAVATHVALSNPHSQYFLASGVSGFGATLIDDANATTARGTLGLGTMAVATETDYLLANGSRAGAVSALQPFTSGIVTGIVRPASDLTTAFRVQNAAGSADVLTVNTTNQYVVVGTADSTQRTLQVYGNLICEKPAGDSRPNLDIKGGANPYAYFRNDTVVGKMQAIDSPDDLFYLGTQSAHSTHFITSNFSRGYVSAAGYWRFGYPDTPTAVVDIAESSSSRASLRMRAGATVSSPNDGDLWYLSADRLKFRRSSTTETIASGVVGTGAAATAGASYTSTEQAMLQAVYNAARAFGMLN